MLCVSFQSETPSTPGSPPHPGLAEGAHTEILGGPMDLLAYFPLINSLTALQKLVSRIGTPPHAPPSPPPEAPLSSGVLSYRCKPSDVVFISGRLHEACYGLAFDVQDLALRHRAGLRYRPHTWLLAEIPLRISDDVEAQIVRTMTSQPFMLGHPAC